MRLAKNRTTSQEQSGNPHPCAPGQMVTAAVVCRVLVLLWGVAFPNSTFGQTLADAVDSPAYSWLGAGDVPWAGGTAVTHDGVDAGSSGVLAKGQKSVLRTTVIGPGSVTFWWKVSSTIYDYLEFDRSGNYQAEISGKRDGNSVHLQSSRERTCWNGSTRRAARPLREPTGRGWTRW